MIFDGSGTLMRCQMRGGRMQQGVGGYSPMIFFDISIFHFAGWVFVFFLLFQVFLSGLSTACLWEESWLKCENPHWFVFHSDAIRNNMKTIKLPTPIQTLIQTHPRHTMETTARHTLSLPRFRIERDAQRPLLRNQKV